MVIEEHIYDKLYILTCRGKWIIGLAMLDCHLIGLDYMLLI